MKKSVIFLINGLGIERAGSYSISIDQTMPNLSRTKETSYFTTAITSSLEYKSAYQRFFLGDTSALELDYIKNTILNEDLKNNITYQNLSNDIAIENTKVHMFVEPKSEGVVDKINDLVNTFSLAKDKKVYLHLLLTQQTVAEYDKLISIINYIKFHLNEHITVGFVIGKESLSDQITPEQLDFIKKLFFYCSAERWTNTEYKLQDLKSNNIRPCEIQGFCTTNQCYISNNDTIMFFNTNGVNYDNIISSIMDSAPGIFKEDSKLHYYSLIKLDTKYNIPCFKENVEYDSSLSSKLQRNNKKALILTDNENMGLVNFYANGLNPVNNPIISFMNKDDNLYNKDYINNLINATDYDLFIFDYHMDVSSTINNLKNQLSKLDIIIGHLADACVNKNSLFVTSLYGLKKELPVADYNMEKVLIDYEMQIPIFFFDYTYPRSKYDLFPGETNDILDSALKCITDDPTIDSLIRTKTVVGSLLKAFIR